MACPAASAHILSSSHALGQVSFLNEMMIKVKVYGNCIHLC